MPNAVPVGEASADQVDRREERDPDDEVEAECKRRRLCLQVSREEFELEKEKVSFDLERAQKELAIEEQRCELEKRKSTWINTAQVLIQ